MPAAKSIGAPKHRGAEALKQADAVVYDALVDERLLSLAPEDAEIVFADATWAAEEAVA